jgi:hypothetical protein
MVSSIATARQLPVIVRRQPRLVINIDIGNEQGSLTLEQFQDRAFGAAAIYGNLWNEIDAKCKVFSPRGPVEGLNSFFTMSHPFRRARRRGDLDIDWHAEFVRSGTPRLFDDSTLSFASGRSISTRGPCLSISRS